MGERARGWSVLSTMRAAANPWIFVWSSVVAFYVSSIASFPSDDGAPAAIMSTTVQALVVHFHWALDCSRIEYPMRRHVVKPFFLYRHCCTLRANMDASTQKKLSPTVSLILKLLNLKAHRT